MKKRVKKYVAVVNGERVWKYASGVDDLKCLLRREAFERTGKFILTDYKLLGVSNDNPLKTQI